MFRSGGNLSVSSLDWLLVGLLLTLLLSLSCFCWARSRWESDIVAARLLMLLFTQNLCVLASIVDFKLRVGADLNMALTFETLSTTFLFVFNQFLLKLGTEWIVLGVRICQTEFFKQVIFMQVYLWLKLVAIAEDLFKELSCWSDLLDACFVSCDIVNSFILNRFRCSIFSCAFVIAGIFISFYTISTSIEVLECHFT